jgi:phosphate transport system permease protein
MAVVANEPGAGWLGRALRAMLSVMASVPPIVYALMSIVFIEIFISPKLSGVGGVYEAAAPPGMYWWSVGGLPNGGSTLLGGMMIALLVIPFMAPLIDDALRNVPGELKEASLALGASRWQTLTGVVLPFAMTGVRHQSAWGP